MEQFVLTAKTRKETGKGPARRLRSSGKLPGVIYKAGQPTLSLSVETDKLLQIIHLGRNTLIKLALDEAGSITEQMAMIKGVQREPIFDKLVHVDFIGIDLDKPLDVEISLEFEGTPEGAAFGGILQQNLRTLLIRCLPADIPKQIKVDVSKLKIGETLHVKDLTLPGGINCIEDADASVGGVLAPQLEAVKAVEEGEEGAEAAAEEVKKEGADKKKEGGDKKKEGADKK